MERNQTMSMSSSEKWALFGFIAVLAIFFIGLAIALDLVPMYWTMKPRGVDRIEITASFLLLEGGSYHKKVEITDPVQIHEIMDSYRVQYVHPGIGNIMMAPFLTVEFFQGDRRIEKIDCYGNNLVKTDASKSIDVDPGFQQLLREIVNRHEDKSPDAEQPKAE